MSLNFVIIYFFLITSTGYAIKSRFHQDNNYHFLVSFIIGIFSFNLIFFVLGQLHYLNLSSIIITLTIFLIISSFYKFPLVTFVSKIFQSSQSLIKIDKNNNKILIVSFAILILWYIILSYLPARSGDAMRYHLAQMKDLYKQQGFVFRPYFHYNFPMLLQMTFFPIFFFFKDVGMKLVVLFHFAGSLLLSLEIAKNIHIKSLWVIGIWLFLTPISFQEATIVTNDWILIFYILAGYRFLDKSLNYTKKNVVFYSFSAMFCLSLALSTKYQAILFLPWFLFLTYINVKKLFSLKETLFTITFSLIILGLLSSPYYLRNFINTGSPFWPLLLDLFKCDKNYLYEVTQRYNNAMSGSHSLSGLYTTLKTALTNPFILSSIWFLGLTSIILHPKKLFRIMSGFVSFFFFWWLIEPKMYWRFSVYIMPFAIISAIYMLDSFREKKDILLFNITRIIILVTFLAGVYIGVLYTKGFIPYIMHKNLNDYHQATWYYQEYQWLNTHLAKESKILVIVQSGHTYYLDHKYLRAEPQLSGFIDWNNINSLDQLLKQLKNLHITHIFFDTHNWSAYPGGNNMNKLIQQLEKSQYCTLQRKTDIALCTSRIRDHFQPTCVKLLKIQNL